jgi:phospholipase/lecithinase/hemolysin
MANDTADYSKDLSSKNAEVIIPIENAFKWDDILSTDLGSPVKIVRQQGRLGFADRHSPDLEPSKVTQPFHSEYLQSEKSRPRKDDFLDRDITNFWRSKESHSFPPTFHDRPGKHPKFTSINIFGDSLSDTGNLSTLTYQASGGQFWAPPSPPLPAFSFPFGGPYSSKVPYFNSTTDPTLPPKVRASDGIIWADILPGKLGLGSQQINNFAFNGATTGYRNGVQPLLPTPFNQLLPLPGLLTEIDNFVANTQKTDPKGLYVVWAGANDGFNLAGSLASQPTNSLQATLSGIIGTVKSAVTNIETAITTLAHQGAKTFLVPNLPDLGRTPLLALNKNSALVGTAFSLLFDIALAKKLPKLEQSLKIDIVEPNVYALTQDALNNPQNFGFSNVTDPLIAQNPLDPTVDPSKFFWYDYQHPTTEVHQILADFFQDNLFASGYSHNKPTAKLHQDLPQSEDLFKLGIAHLQQSLGYNDPLGLISKALPELLFAPVDPAIPVIK